MPRRKLTFNPLGKSGYIQQTIVPSERVPIKLYKNQYDVALEGVEILKKYGFLINTSETGAGKTLTTLATAVMLNLPVIVFGPVGASKAWNDSCAKYLTTDYLGFISIDTLKGGGILDAIGGPLISKTTTEYASGRTSNEYTATSYWHAICQKGVFMIFDEAHVVKNVSQRNAAVAPLIKTLITYPQSYYALLSATLLDKADSAMNFSSMMGLVSNNTWMRKDGGIETYETVQEFIRCCLTKFDFPNKSNRTVKVILNTMEIIEERMGGHLIKRPIRKYYNGSPQAYAAGPNEGGNFYYDSNTHSYVVPDDVDPAQSGRMIPFPVLTKNNYRDLVADLFFDVVMEFVGVEIENVNIARMAYRGFFEVNPAKTTDMYAAVAEFKNAARQIISRTSGTSHSGVSGTEIDFGAVNVAIMHIEELMADTYIGLAMQKLNEAPIQLPDGRYKYNRVVIALNYHSSLEYVQNILSSQLVHNMPLSQQMLVFHGKIPYEKRDEIIDLWNNPDERNPYRVFLMTAATGGMSISLHDTIGTRHTILYYSPDYQMIKAHQTMGRIFRHGQKSIGEGYLVYPRLEDDQIDGIMLALARKSAYILRTRRYKTINSKLLTENAPKTDVNFPGTYPRFVQQYGYLDEHKIDTGCAEKTIPKEDCEAIANNVVKYVMRHGQYAFFYTPVPPPIKDVEEPLVGTPTEGGPIDMNIYNENFRPGFVYLDGSINLIGNWGNIKQENGKWVFTGVSIAGIDPHSQGFNQFGFGNPIGTSFSTFGVPSNPWDMPSISMSPWGTPFVSGPSTPSNPWGTPSISGPSTPSNPWDTPSISGPSTPSGSSIPSNPWGTSSISIPSMISGPLETSSISISSTSSNPWDLPSISGPSTTSSNPWDLPTIPTTPSGPSTTSSNPWDLPSISGSSTTSSNPWDLPSISGSSTTSSNPWDLPSISGPSTTSSNPWDLPTIPTTPSGPSTTQNTIPVDQFIQNLTINSSMSKSNLPSTPTEF